MNHQYSQWIISTHHDLLAFIMNPIIYEESLSFLRNPHYLREAFMIYEESSLFMRNPHYLWGMRIIYEDSALFMRIPHYLYGIFMILGTQGAWGMHTEEMEGQRKGCTGQSTQAEPWNSDAQGEDHRRGNKAHKESHTPGDPKGWADIRASVCNAIQKKLIYIYIERERER